MNHTIIYATNGAPTDVKRMTLSIQSLRKATKADIKVIVLSDHTDLSIVGVDQVIDPTPLLRSVGIIKPAMWTFRYAFGTLYRLVIPLLPELSDQDQVLYLDTDTLVKSGHITRLLAYSELDNEIIGAPGSPDSGELRRRVSAYKATMATAFGGKLDQFFKGYHHPIMRSGVNAGVLVWNLRAIRAHGEAWYRERLTEFYKGVLQRKYWLLDQDFVNIFMDTCPCLEPRFNWWRKSPNPSCVVRHYIAHQKSIMMKDARDMKLSLAPQAHGSAG